VIRRRLPSVVSVGGSIGEAMRAFALLLFVASGLTPLASLPRGAAARSSVGTILFQGGGGDNPCVGHLYTVRADGSDFRQLTNARGSVADVGGQWSPDGRLIVFTRIRGVPPATTGPTTICS
jgi:hypothetical protein